VKIEAAVRVTPESLRYYGVEAFTRAGLPEEGAQIVTEVQLEAHLRGQPTHNMGNVPGYAQRAASGAMNPRPNIRVERETRLHVHVDGDNGPGQWVSVVAMRHAIERARASGVGIAAAYHSNHFGAAGHYAWLAAQEGLIGICTTNGGPCLAPWGGATPTFGNNPLGVGIPTGGHPTFLLDIAMSVAAMGKIGLAMAEGQPMPPDWILDPRGQPSINPDDFRASRLGVPIGAPAAGHKGYGLTMVMELLAGVLTGASFPWEHREARLAGRSDPNPNLGHFFMAIDPEMFMTMAEFKARVDDMIDAAKSAKLADGANEILVPGEMEMRARERNLREGVPLLPSTYRALLDYAQQAGLETNLVAV